jgi:hypothetical protein
VLVLITSANVANLLMARAASRSREVALRAALGARRGRLARQFLTESVTLALLGAVVAIPVVMVAMAALRNFVSNVTAVIAFDADFRLDVRVLATLLVMAIGAGLVAGLAPSLAVCRADLGARLKIGARGTADGSGQDTSAIRRPPGGTPADALVSGGLFIRSLDRARHIDLGFEPAGMLLATAARLSRGHDFEAAGVLHGGAIACRHSRRGAGGGFTSPLALSARPPEVAPEPRPSDPDWRPSLAAEADISPGTSRLRARGSSKDECSMRGSSRQHAGGHQPETGRGFCWVTAHSVARWFPMATGSRSWACAERQVSERQRTAAQCGLPARGNVPVTATVAIRTSGSPGARRAVRHAPAQADPEVPVYDLRPMNEHLDNGNAFFPFRLAAFMTSLFGGMGGLLASIGLYGMIAYHVGQRTQEIGVRMALGARAGDIIRDVLARGGRFAVIGIGIGVVLAAGLAQLLEGLLLGVSPFDPSRTRRGRPVSDHGRLVRARPSRDDGRSAGRAAS